jgi:hypothetical protein
MLLMRDGDWVGTGVRVWKLIVQSNLPNGAALALLEAPLVPC